MAKRRPTAKRRPSDGQATAKRRRPSDGGQATTAKRRVEETLNDSLPMF